MARLVSLGIIAALILLLGITCYQVIAPFLVPLLLGAVTAMLCQPLFQYFMRRLKNRRPWAAAATTASILCGLMIPLLAVILFGIIQIIQWSYVGLEQASDVSLLDLNSETTNVNLERIRDTSFEFCNTWILGGHVQQFDRSFLQLSQEEIASLSRNRNELTERRRDWFDPWFEKQIVELNAQLGKLAQALVSKTLGVVGKTIGHTIGTTLHLLATLAGLVVALAVFALSLYYFLADGPDLILAAESLIPIERDYQRELAAQFVKAVRAVVLATFLAALGQGIATAIALKIVGINYFFLMMIISTFAAMIPMAGPFLVWFPVACWLLWSGHWGSALFLLIIGIGVIGTLDNVIRTFVLQSDTKLHPLLAFVSVLGGLQVMGLWGVFIGPVVACCLHVLIKIFNQEVQSMPLGSGVLAMTTGTAGDPSLSPPGDDAATGTTSDPEAGESTPATNAESGKSEESGPPEPSESQLDSD